MSKLILFDLDQTLIDALEHHEVAFERTFDEVFDVEAKLTEIEFAGKTIPQIIRELAEFKGIPKEKVDSRLSKAVERIGLSFKESVETGEVDVLPGARELLEELRNREQVLGIVTGTIEDVARAILEESGLEKYFDVFAFGSESEDRDELVRLAISKAEEEFDEEFHGEDVIIVGDSIHDIDSGKAHNALTIIVTTGFHSEEELKEHSPDFMFQDLTDPQILEILE